MTGSFSLFAQLAKREPVITKVTFEDLGDDPDKHRWRAWWLHGDDSGMGGIELRAYPVVKINRKSVWINADAYRERRQWAAFDPAWMKKRLLYNNSRSAWAKPTQDDAIHSIAVRLCRWSDRLRNEVERAEAAAMALDQLRPDLAWASEQARKNLAGERS